MLYEVITDASVVPVMYVRAADTDGSDFKANLPFCRRLQGVVGKIKLF